MESCRERLDPEKIDKHCLRELAYYLIADAIGDLKYSSGRQREHAKAFLIGRIGDIEGWLDCMHFEIPTEVITKRIKDMVAGRVDIPDEFFAQRAHHGTRAAVTAPRKRYRKDGQIPHRGEMLNVNEAAKLTGIPYGTLYNRFRSNPGKDLEFLAGAGKKKYEVKL